MFIQVGFLFFPSKTSSRVDSKFSSRASDEEKISQEKKAKASFSRIFYEFIS